ncbi:hypothetical protein XNC1_1894 [Xenorhabdus nematophila ATCC 19061]|uniref:Uncharacterized protein n=1 Tax=Xenorhabdus nematophila (strain ATCC 19061 / DSM 3370 / CCUG 14189 / LMG 1036 / NCIMB 9965 / AN6) TaxID=406817 RepID=D3VDN7_XENNA|nr:hypothetical protein XNC1_1894 [Xenorhabdus nematophila ATCC 19061]CEE91102.1 hypothetical protein XNA1_1960030 [Xenorhabdus nematophila str. Anatoliense]CEE93534.1 hypothetical protein XNA1_390030 [Xenorhabdus nematophila str. Anatoliense]
MGLNIQAVKTEKIKTTHDNTIFNSLFILANLNIKVKYDDGNTIIIKQKYIKLMFLAP